MSILSGKSRCRAKNKATCAYHGNPLRQEDQGEALATSTQVIDATAGVLVNHDDDALLWNHATVKRFSHLVTAFDSKKFTRDVLKARYGFEKHSAKFGELEERAGSMYRARMRDTAQRALSAKNGPFPLRHEERDVALALHGIQFQAEYDAEQHRKTAINIMRDRKLSDWEKESRIKDEMARSLAASAHAFRVNQLCENMGNVSNAHPYPEEAFTF